MQGHGPIIAEPCLPYFGGGGGGPLPIKQVLGLMIIIIKIIVIVMMRINMAHEALQGERPRGIQQLVVAVRAREEGVVLQEVDLRSWGSHKKRGGGGVEGLGFLGFRV